MQDQHLHELFRNCQALQETIMFDDDGTHRIVNEDGESTDIKSLAGQSFMMGVMTLIDMINDL